MPHAEINAAVKVKCQMRLRRPGVHLKIRRLWTGGPPLARFISAYVRMVVCIMMCSRCTSNREGSEGQISIWRSEGCGREVHCWPCFISACCTCDVVHHADAVCMQKQGSAGRVSSLVYQESWTGSPLLAECSSVPSACLRCMVTCCMHIVYHAER
jgi:hypothetical protein